MLTLILWLAADITVCASGCTYTTLQAALDAVASNDTITITAGAAAVTGGEIARQVENVTIRTSRYAELPPRGTRVEAGSAVLAAVVPTHVSEPGIRIGPKRIYMDAVNLETDTITLEYETSRHLPTNGAQITCGVITIGDKAGTLPEPLVRATRYYVRDWNAGARTMKLAATPGGDAIDLTTQGTAGNASFYKQPFCQLMAAPRNIRLWGLDITETGFGSLPAVMIGDNGNTLAGVGVDSVVLDHVVLRGSAITCLGPRMGVFFYDGQNHGIYDSQILNICSTNGDENKAVAIVNASNVDILNNRLEAGSIGVLVGGTEPSRLANSSYIRIRGNYVIKPGNLKYRQGSGAPTGDCYYEGGSGEFYRDTVPDPNTCANGACYKCQSDGTWAATTDEAVYRATRNGSKNAIELKECAHCAIEQNAIVGTFGTLDQGQGWAFGGSVLYSTTTEGGSGPWVQVRDTVFRRNSSRRVWGGAFLRNSHGAYIPPGDTWTQWPMERVVFQNNLFTDMAQIPQLQESAASTADRFTMSPSAGMSASLLEKNTMRGASVYGYQWENASDSLGAFQGNATSLHRNNIMDAATYPTYAARAPSGTQVTTCAGWGTYFGGTLANNVLVTSAGGTPLNFNGTGCGTYATNTIYSATSPDYASDSRLNTTSPYSASNGSATLLATDGSDMGADIDLIAPVSTAAIAGTTPLQPVIVPNPAGGLQVRIPATCTATFYSQPRKLVGDVVAAGSVSGKYWYRVTCDGTLAAAGEGAR